MGVDNKVSRPCYVFRMGLTPYEDALRLQNNLAKARGAGEKVRSFLPPRFLNYLWVSRFLQSEALDIQRPKETSHTPGDGMSCQSPR